MALPNTLHTCITIISKSQEKILKITNLVKKGFWDYPPIYKFNWLKRKKEGGGWRSIPFSLISKKIPWKTPSNWVDLRWRGEGAEREREGEELHSGLGLAQGENEWGRRKGVGPARVKGVAHPGRVHQQCWRHGMWDDASVADAPPSPRQPSQVCPSPEVAW